MRYRAHPTCHPSARKSGHLRPTTFHWGSKELAKRRQRVRQPLLPMLCWMRFGRSGLFTSIRRLPQKSFGKQSRGQWPESKAHSFPGPDASADSTPTIQWSVRLGKWPLCATFGLMHRSKQLKLFDRFVGASEQEMRHCELAELARVTGVNSPKAICA